MKKTITFNMTCPNMTCFARLIWVRQRRFPPSSNIIVERPRRRGEESGGEGNNVVERAMADEREPRSARAAQFIIPRPR